jgi:hypothetical protein
MLGMKSRLCTAGVNMLFFNSGYAYLGGGLGGNVLLAFGVE